MPGHEWPDLSVNKQDRAVDGGVEKEEDTPEIRQSATEKLVIQVCVCVSYACGLTGETGIFPSALGWQASATAFTCPKPTAVRRSFAIFSALR